MAIFFFFSFNQLFMNVYIITPLLFSDFHLRNSSFRFFFFSINDGVAIINHNFFFVYNTLTHNIVAT